jgi:hypothetical protein
LPKYFDKDIAEGLNNINKLSNLKLDHYLKFNNIPNGLYPKLNSILNLSLALNFKGEKFFNEVCRLFPNIKTFNLYCSYIPTYLLYTISSNFLKLTHHYLKINLGFSVSVRKSQTS